MNQVSYTQRHTTWMRLRGSDTPTCRNSKWRATISVEDDLLDAPFFKLDLVSEWSEKIYHCLAYGFLEDQFLNKEKMHLLIKLVCTICWGDLTKWERMVYSDVMCKKVNSYIFVNASKLLKEYYMFLCKREEWGFTCHLLRDFQFVYSLVFGNHSIAYTF